MLLKRIPLLPAALSLVLSAAFAGACGGSAYRPGEDGGDGNDRRTGRDSSPGDDTSGGDDATGGDGTGGPDTATADAPGPIDATPPPDGVTPDGVTPPPPGNCASCGEVVMGQADPADACTDNGPPSSADTLAALTQCSCVDSCTAECGQNVCAGGQPDQACQACVFQNCPDEGQACLQDPGQPPPGSCAGCQDVLTGQAAAADLCTDNGPPSSQEVFDDLNQCACIDECANQCGDNVCTGGQPSQACQQCVGQNCSAEAQECFGDQGTQPPTDCISCRSTLTGGGDPADLCTDNGPPSSADIFADLNQCTCVDGCADECGQNACAGGQPDGACQACVFQNCGTEAQACFGDG